MKFLRLDFMKLEIGYDRHLVFVSSFSLTIINYSSTVAIIVFDVVMVAHLLFVTSYFMNKMGRLLSNNGTIFH